MVRNNDSEYAGLWDNASLPAGDSGAYASTYFIPYTIKDGIPFRMEETNSYSNHGAEGASDTYAAAVWGLDYEYWLVAHDAAGVNFMTGFNSQNALSPLSYSAFQSIYVSAANSTTTQMAYGLAYGMVALKMVSQGKPVQTTSAITNVSTAFNLSCYSVVGNDGVTYVTIINKDNLGNTPTVRSANVTVLLPSTHTISSVQSCQLLGTGNSIAAGDISNKSGITIGGKVINADGTWTGGFSNGALNLVQSQPNVIALSVPSASATVLKLLTSIVPNAPSDPGITPLSDSQFNRTEPPTLTYKLEASPDLAGWTNIAWLKPDGNPWSGPATTIPVAKTGTGSTRAVTVTDSQLKTVSRCRFLRLSVMK